MRPSLLPLFLAIGLLACSDPQPPTTGSGTMPATPAMPPADQRDAWQQPAELLKLMGNDLTGLVVADLFAGDGYFTFKLIDAGASVIAIDNDPANIATLEARKRERGLGDDRLRIRAVPVGDPGLAPNEADMALLVHHYVTIQDKPTYFGLLRRGLKEPRVLFMIEWQAKQTPIGPPMAQRMMTEQIMDEVGGLGFNEVGAYSAKMPHQVIYFASDPMDEADMMFHRLGGASQ